MRESERYAKIVEWSDEEQCYVGSSPGLIWVSAAGQTKEPYLTNYAG